MFVYEGIFPLMSLEHSWAWKWDISKALNQVQTSEEEFTKVTKQSKCHLSPNSNKTFFLVEQMKSFNYNL